jgi:prevent-host-death family protein
MTKHWALQDAKARLSELVRAARTETQIITYRGEPAVEVKGVKGKNRKKPAALAKAAPAEKDELRRETPRWWAEAPRVKGFKLPSRKRERMRKIDF